MSKVIMVQGTMSNAGKSLIVGALCRIFAQDGYRVSPFKSQNMALNSFITPDGFEMGRAQVMQAECAKVTPSVYMNPVLLKPTNDVGSQVIVNGRAIGNMSARDYFKYKKNLVPDILNAFHELEKQSDIIVIEGAGSPAEINLKENDIVNMGLAKLVDAPVLLVGDIDRGGVFAQLLGTLMLLEDDEKARVKGLIINKFRGDKSLLDSGIEMLEEKGGVPVVGTIPYTRLLIDDEDSLSERLDNKSFAGSAAVKIAVVRLPRISNFTDLAPFESINGIEVNFTVNPREADDADIIVIPGSKNTVEDMIWLRESGFADRIVGLSKREDGPLIIGICGGFQMLGQEISDPLNVESGKTVSGLGILPVTTELLKDKHQSQTKGEFKNLSGSYKTLSGKTFMGYEIHNGITKFTGDEKNLIAGENDQGKLLYIQGDRVFGTYLHGAFDEGSLAFDLANEIALKKGKSLEAPIDYQAFKEEQYDILAEAVRANIDMDLIYKILEIK